MQKHVSSGAVIYVQDGSILKYLLMYREKSNSWHLPKGSQNLGETLEEIALREIEEETGLKVKLQKYLTKLDSLFEKEGESIQKETHYFLACPLDSKFSLSNHDHEHDSLHLLDYEIALNHLQDFSLFEKEGEVLKMAERVLRQNK